MIVDGSGVCLYFDPGASAHFCSLRAEREEKESRGGEEESRG